MHSPKRPVTSLYTAKLHSALYCYDRVWNLLFSQSGIKAVDHNPLSSFLIGQKGNDIHSPVTTQHICKTDAFHYWYAVSATTGKKNIYCYLNSILKNWRGRSPISNRIQLLYVKLIKPIFYLNKRSKNLNMV